MLGAASKPSPARSSGLMEEFIGGILTVVQAPGVQDLPLTGRIVDETLNMMYVLPSGARRPRGIPKAGLVGTLTLGSREIPLRGDDLRVRPEDRIKRMALRGHRRRP